MVDALRVTLPPGSEFHPVGLTIPPIKPSADCASSAPGVFQKNLLLRKGIGKANYIWLIMLF